VKISCTTSGPTGLRRPRGFFAGAAAGFFAMRLAAAFLTVALAAEDLLETGLFFVGITAL
jgi:hypothetical protein